MAPEDSLWVHIPCSWACISTVDQHSKLVMGVLVGGGMGLVAEPAGGAKI